jgi:lipoprotein NlpI
VNPLLLFLMLSLLAPVLAFSQQSAEDLVGAGVSEARSGDFDQAIAHFNQAVRLNPKQAEVYNYRGITKARIGDIEGAIADFDQAVQLDPKYDNGYLNRGIVRQTKGDFEGALSDYLRYNQLASQRLPTDYVNLYIWLVRARQSGIAEANKELSAYLGERRDPPPHDWVSKIEEFLQDKISEADLFLAANSPEAGKRRRLCDAWFFSGMKDVLVGDKKAAADHFLKCLAMHTLTSEYLLAQSELKKLRN